VSSDNDSFSQWDAIDVASLYAKPVLERVHVHDGISIGFFHAESVAVTVVVWVRNGVTITAIQRKLYFN